MADNIKIMLVEDHKLIRVGIKTLFEETDGFDVIAEAEYGKDAINKAIISKPDIILLDLILPDISGIKVLNELYNIESESKVIVLSSKISNEDIEKSLSLGAYAYVIKDINTEILLYIVKTVNDGAIWLDPKIVPFLRDRNQKVIPEYKTNRAKFRSSHSNLTQREYEVLKLVVDGKSNNDIANELCISEHTAKAHVCNIIQKLLVEDRTQAAVKAIKEGIV